MINIACDNKLYIMNYKLLHSSSVVEQSAVNRTVVGSNPTGGAIDNTRRAVRAGRRSMIGNHVDRHRSQGFKSLALRHSKTIIIWPLGQAVKTSPFHGGNTGSSPVGVTIYFISWILGGLAQLGEHLPYKQGVAGSSPASSTMQKNPHIARCSMFLPARRR